MVTRAFTFPRLAPGAAAAAVCCASAVAQWPSDPALNLPISDRSGLQTHPKIRATADGGCYISWLDGYPTGFDINLQRLDPLGSEMWPHNGRLVADRSISFTQDYGLGVDVNGNALLIYRNEKWPDDQIIAACIDPDGAPLWGDDGVVLASQPRIQFLGLPKIVSTSDGDLVAAWSADSDIVIQKLDRTGKPLWGDGVSLSNTDGIDLFLCDLQASLDGAVIVSWVRRGRGPCDPGHLYAQKLDADGNLLWGARQHGGEHLVVFDGGSLCYGHFPSFITDDSGGAVFCWYTHWPALQCFAQHVRADGTEAFGHNGSVASHAPYPRVNPGVCFSPDRDETFLFWIEENWPQTQHGVYGQKFDSHGVQKWGYFGIEFVPMSADGPIAVPVVPCNEGAMIFYTGYFLGDSEMNLHAMRIDADGQPVWTPGDLLVCAAQSNPNRIDAAVIDDGTALLAWVDGRNADDDIYAQNVHPDGTLGNHASPTDVRADGVMGVLDPLAVLAAWGP